jgi:hypothetical protein
MGPSQPKKQEWAIPSSIVPKPSISLKFLMETNIKGKRPKCPSMSRSSILGQREYSFLVCKKLRALKILFVKIF